MKSSKILKVFVLFLLIAAGYHMTGMESAFCDDSSVVEASDHGCEICRPGHHTAVHFENQISGQQLIPLNFSLVNYPSLQMEEFSTHFFRPPISL